MPLISKKDYKNLSTEMKACHLICPWNHTVFSPDTVEDWIGSVYLPYMQEEHDMLHLPEDWDMESFRETAREKVREVGTMLLTHISFTLEPPAKKGRRMNQEEIMKLSEDMKVCYSLSPWVIVGECETVEEWVNDYGYKQHIGRFTGVQNAEKYAKEYSLEQVKRLITERENQLLRRENENLKNNEPEHNLKDGTLTYEEIMELSPEMKLCYYVWGWFPKLDPQSVEDWAEQIGFNDYTEVSDNHEERVKAAIGDVRSLYSFLTKYDMLKRGK